MWVLEQWNSRGEKEKKEEVGHIASRGSVASGNPLE